MSGSTEQFCVYDTTTGEIVTWGTTGIGESGLVPFEAGQAVYSHVDNGPFTRWTHYISGGAPVAYNDTQATAKRAKPDYQATWNNTTMAWVDGRTLTTAKVRRLNMLLNWWRDADTINSISYEGLTFDTGVIAVTRLSVINSAVARLGALPPWFTGSWRSNEGDYLPIPTVADWDLFFAAVAGGVIARYQHAQTLRDLILTRTTNAQVEEITWETGL